MAGSVAEQVRLDDFKAQCRSIAINKKIANRELEEVLDSVVLEKDTLKSITKEVQIEAIQLIKIREEGTVSKQRIINAELVLHDKEQVLIRQKNDMLKALDKKREKVSREDRALGVELRKVAQKIQVLKERKEKALDDVVLLKQQVQQAMVEKDKTKALVKQFQEEAKQAEQQGNQVVKDSKKEIFLLTKAVQKLQTQVKKEEGRVITLHTSLAERERVVVLREVDAAVLVNRLRVLYKEILPGTILTL